MKRVSYILGIVSCLLIFIGSMFKVQHWPGAAILLVAGILSFILIFLPVALIHHYNTTAEKKNFWLHVVTFLTGLVVFASALFKILHWPGAGFMLLFSIPFPFIVFLPVFIYTSRKNNTPIREYSYILMLLLFYALTASLLSLNVSKNVIDEGILSLRQCSNVEQNSILSSQVILAEAKTSDKPMSVEIKKIHASSEMLSSSLTKMIKVIATSVNSNNELAIDSDGKIDFSIIHSLDVIVSGEQLFYTGREGSDLKNKINEYKNLLLSAGSIRNTPTAELIQKLLDTSGNGELSWEAANFGRFHLVWLLNSMANLKCNIRICEAETMKALL